MHFRSLDIISSRDQVFISHHNIRRRRDPVAQRPNQPLMMGVAAAVRPALMRRRAAARVVFTRIALTRKPREVRPRHLTQPLRRRKHTGIGKNERDRHKQGERRAQSQCHHPVEHAELYREARMIPV